MTGGELLAEENSLSLGCLESGINSTDENVQPSVLPSQPGQSVVEAMLGSGQGVLLLFERSVPGHGMFWSLIYDWTDRHNIIVVRGERNFGKKLTFDIRDLQSRIENRQAGLRMIDSSTRWPEVGSWRPDVGTLRSKSDESQFTV